MAFPRQHVDVLGPSMAKTIAATRRLIEQLGRKLTDQESEVFLGSFCDLVSPIYALKIVEAMSVTTTPNKTKPRSERVTGVSSTRGQFEVKPELFERGRQHLTKHKAALLAAIDAGNDTHLALKSVLDAEGFEIASMIQALVAEGTIEVLVCRRPGKRAIQKYRVVPPKVEEPSDPGSSSLDVEPPNSPPPRPTDAEAWQDWVWAKCRTARDPLKFSQLTRAATLAFGQAPSWPLVFADVRQSPSPEKPNGKHFMVDLDDELVG